MSEVPLYRRCSTRRGVRTLTTTPPHTRCGVTGRRQTVGCTGVPLHPLKVHLEPVSSEVAGAVWWGGRTKGVFYAGDPNPPLQSRCGLVGRADQGGVLRGGP
ncbi:hypothetical protein T484DRAFT_2407203 [Baffinella frigidus]|nr:hypothetical protein T484DRAFT_2407203 [Cryptophyta sp. CCMP2293]